MPATITSWVSSTTNQRGWRPSHTHRAKYWTAGGWRPATPTCHAEWRQQRTQRLQSTPNIRPASLQQSPEKKTRQNSQDLTRPPVENNAPCLHAVADTATRKPVQATSQAIWGVEGRSRHQPQVRSSKHRKHAQTLGSAGVRSTAPSTQAAQRWTFSVDENACSSTVRLNVASGQRYGSLTPVCLAPLTDTTRGTRLPLTHLYATQYVPDGCDPC